MNMKYYYFKVRNGRPYQIKVSDIEINCEINRIYRQMTAEQEAFYLEHPTASVQEVWDCQLIPPYVPPVVPIEQLREEALRTVDGLSRDTLAKFVDSLGFANAAATSLYAKAKGIVPVYDDDEVLSTATEFLEKSRSCREAYQHAASEIAAAETEAEVNTALSNARAAYEEIALNSDSVRKHIQRKLIEIDVWDNSSNVNGFYYNNNLMWLDKSTRVGLVNTLNSAEELGRQTVNIWYADQVCIELSVDEARMMLAAIELYATDCYNVTASHKKAVSEMDDIEEIDAFDVTVGYPAMLHFDTESFK